METHLKIVGSILIVLALVHFIFPKYFHWKKELAQLSLINRQMMQVHTFFVALTVAMMGVLCLVAAPDLVNTPLGNKIALGLAIFWGIRLFCQLFVYSPKLWQGKRFETSVHVAFTIFWGYLTWVFGSVAF